MRLDPYFHTVRKLTIIDKGKVIGEVFTLPSQMTEKGRRYWDDKIDIARRSAKR
ncbi:hypothetical protein ACFSR7_35835 [Cohnella sp. GCM10020058]|uniref:hypothetical protein n=1 Tax=Cohnella sp. GCM10020058 TaxID=3317330 RepID=UPI0036414E23